MSKPNYSNYRGYLYNIVNAARSLKRPDVIDIILLLLPLLALFLWLISLQPIPLNAMNDLGLISALSPWIIAALGILVISFTFTLQRPEIRVVFLAFQLTCIILILYATPNLTEEMPHYIPAYSYAGYTNFIMQTGTLMPGVDAHAHFPDWGNFYANFPGFFALTAFFTKISGYATILSYMGWTQVVYNLIYVGPLYTIFTSITINKRLVWLGLLFFYLTNWVEQDYFSPQGLNFFLYLVIIMILLKWFRIPPKERIQPGQNASLVQKFFTWLKAPDPQSANIEAWQRRGLLCCLIVFFGLSVFSHPLTPFFIALAVLTLVIFRRCNPLWLPILMLAMIAFWDSFVAGPYLFAHYNFTVSLGNLLGNLPKTITSGKLSGDPLYHIIATMRLSMTILLWLLAFLGGIKRLKQGNRDITYILLALAGFSLIVAQSYGGEMLMRIYLFTEPFMCFFAASLFFDNSTAVAQKSAHTHATIQWRTAVIITANLILLGAFFFTRYGDDRVDYISSEEWNAVQYLYQHAPTNALILEGWDAAPLYLGSLTKYDIESLSILWPSAVINTNSNEIIQVIENKNNSYSYIIFSQEEQVQATSSNAMPGNTLSRLEKKLLLTEKFTLIYSNSDAQILQFTG